MGLFEVITFTNDVLELTMIKCTSERERNQLYSVKG